MSGSGLSSIRIAVTRAQAQAEELAAPLRELGADVLVAPLIRIEPSPESEQVRTAIHNLGQYDWLVLTSANGVRLFADALSRYSQSTDALSHIRIGCVGPVTAAAAADHGICSEIIPDEFTGSALASTLAKRVTAARVLLARAGGAREELPKRLAEHAARVDEIELYRSGPDLEGAHLLRERIVAEQIDLVTFTSGSTVRYFSAFVGRLDRAIAAVIGPSTAETAKQHNIPVAIEANPHTTHGLIHAIAEHFRRVKRPSEE